MNVQTILQIVFCAGVVSAVVVAGAVAIQWRDNREQAIATGLFGLVGTGLLLVGPVLISRTLLEPDQAQEPSSAADTAPMDWTPWLWALGAILGALTLVGLIVGAVKARKKVKKRRRVHKETDAKLIDGQVQEHKHWQNAVRRHDALRADFYALESDPMARLTIPAFWDFTRPLSTAWWDAQGAADNRRTERVPADPAWRHEYVDAVDRAARAFAVARDDARRVGLTAMDPNERRRVERAQKALSTVLDDASTEAERRLAYRVVLDSINGIVDLPPVMRRQLTARTGRELTAAEKVVDR